MDDLRQRFFSMAQDQLKRETLIVDPEKVFTTGLDNEQFHTFQKQYIFHNGEMWRVERIDGKTADLCEVTVGENSELQTIVHAASQRMSVQDFTKFFI